MGKWYVYILCDPDTEIPFYVGKGTGNRMDYHELLRPDGNIAKQDAIRCIQAKGKQVLKKKIAEFTDEQEAYIYERETIALYRETLTNIRPGGGGIRQPEKVAPKELDESKTYHSLTDAAAYLAMSVHTLNLYLKDLRIKPTKFKRDRKAYLALEVVKSIQKYKTDPSTRPKSAEKKVK